MKSIINNHEKEYVKKKHLAARLICLTLALALVAVGVVQVMTRMEVTRLGYHETGSVDYQVCLKENSYFSEECLGANRQYIANIIKNISTQLNYSFSADAQMDLTYDYDIVARTVATDKDESKRTLYDKEEVLLEKTGGSQKSSRGFVINKSLDIDYSKYNRLITAFRNDYVLSLNANLIVTMRVQVTGSHPDFAEKLAISQDVSITIPLTERTINVSMDARPVEKSAALERVQSDIKSNLIWYALVAVGALGVLVSLLLSIWVVVRTRRAESHYDKELHKILKEYSQLVIEADSIPELDKTKLIVVHSFDELLDARETIQKPIVHVELDDDRSLFVIEDLQMPYAFILAGQHAKQKGKTRVNSSKKTSHK